MNAMKGRRVQKIDLSAPADQAPARHGGKKEGLKLKPSNGAVLDKTSSRGIDNQGSALASPYFSTSEVCQIQSSLLRWYDHMHRTLPWRRTPHSKQQQQQQQGKPSAGANKTGDPQEALPAPDDLDAQDFAYRVWVSEIMLQQTQVVTVIPYFNKWVSKWPTVADLAGASVEEVNAMWAGLGYYRRARYLLDGAIYVVQKLGGNFPTTAKDLLQIPGVGPYTSAAVASIAFGDPSAAVDGNVIRVVSRLRALPGDPTKLAQVHAAMASEIIDVTRPGCFNQAMMELGATICRPVNPNCSDCPVGASCRAYAELQDHLKARGVESISDLEDIASTTSGEPVVPLVTRFPGKKAPKEKHQQRVAVCVLEVVVTGGDAVTAEREPATEAETLEGAAAGVKAAAGEGGGVGATKAKQPSNKRQRVMSDFFAAEGAPASRPNVLHGERWFVLVQRPEQGLLAGLWEFPSVILEGDRGGARAERHVLLWDLLESLLGVSLPPPPPPAAAAGQRRAPPSDGKDGRRLDGRPEPAVLVHSAEDKGEYVHVFSHIRQSSHVERVVLSVESLQVLQQASTSETGGGATLRWVRGTDMNDAGFPTLTKKIFKQATGK